KAAGLDKIPGRALRARASELAEVLTTIFNLSLSQSTVPTCFKTTTIVPLPKKSPVTCLNNYRPVALTPIIMKCFERVVLVHIQSSIPGTLDPLQYAYRATSDAIAAVVSVLICPPQMAACLPPDQAAIFLFLMRMEGRSFNPADVMEAVQLNRDFPSALRFLTHSCPICQDQVTFSKIITMTHCSCFLCQTCFKTFFSVAIKERSIDQLVCPQCGKPKIRRQGGMEEFMDYFNLLDTQTFVPLTCSCSFGMLHEADLRMDCPSCQKSTCSQCRSPWSPHHQGLSCQQFRVWQQQKQPDHHDTKLLCYNSIECPNCHFIFSLSKGGCLHFTCSQCRHQFCGGCSQTFSLGAACGFSADCGMKGLHAHHPRDCLYHLRDWSVPRLHLLLQDENTGCSSGMCLVLELRDDDSRWEEPCGRPALPEYRGHCQSHYKERLVDLINRCQADPAILFSLAEMTAELQRWNIAVPTRKPDEPEPLYARRLRMVSDIINLCRSL
uniref:Uncharacterized protein n=1 Tax=Monopterus albus TaxID=43700 RepID=A0A3Q3R856_MONAL